MQLACGDEEEEGKVCMLQPANKSHVQQKCSREKKERRKVHFHGMCSRQITNTQEFNSKSNDGKDVMKSAG